MGAVGVSAPAGAGLDDWVMVFGSTRGVVRPKITGRNEGRSVL
jgi:hypothetical protein